jgi:hypothetical protein
MKRAKNDQPVHTKAGAKLTLYPKCPEHPKSGFLTTQGRQRGYVVYFTRCDACVASHKE